MSLFILPAVAGSSSESFPTAAGLPDVRAACQTDNPFLVTACYRGTLRSEAGRPFEDLAPSILAFQETEFEYPHYELANFAEVGAVWGLAYSQTEFAVYAAAFHKRQLPFGPAGPGGIYRISLADGARRTFATVPNAGPDLHDRDLTGPDLPAKPGAGKTSLGDLDLSEDERQLFVMNLADRRIYRYDVGSGDLLGAIAIGAATEPWRADARPFGLEIHAGLLYHGVIRSAELSRFRVDLQAHVYRSELDGSNMEEVAQVGLTYNRGSIHIGTSNTSAKVDWQYWKDNYSNDRDPRFPFVIYPMPMLTDIELDEHNHVILGLRDRIMDTGAPRLHVTNSPQDENLTFGPGDTLHGVFDPTSEKWVFDTAREHYDDDSIFLGDETGQGGLAHIGTLNRLVVGSIGVQPKRVIENPREGFLWYDETTGDPVLREETCAAEVTQRPWPRLVGKTARSPRFNPPPPVERRDPGGAAPAALKRPVAPGAVSAAGWWPASDEGRSPEQTETATATQPPTATRTRFPTAVPMPTPMPTHTPTPGPVRGPGSVGDVEFLCPREVPMPTDTAAPPTDTPRPRTATSTRTPPPTTPVPATPTPRPLYLPNLAKEPLPASEH
jgi:hypothetical protein